MKGIFYFIKNILRLASKAIKLLIIGMIKIYKKYISPIKGAKMCKYIPTCSEYAIEAVEKYGPFKGTYLAIKRILRCNPFSKGGYDPVP